jgi:hypothetical protein
MQLSQTSAVTSNLPGPRSGGVHHGGPADSFHYEVDIVIAEVEYLRCGITVRAYELPGFGFGRQGASVA